MLINLLLTCLRHYKPVVMTVSVGTIQADQNLYHKHVLPLLVRSQFVTFANGRGVIFMFVPCINSIKALFIVPQ
jgi:hypothetical protein